MVFRYSDRQASKRAPEAGRGMDGRICQQVGGSQEQVIRINHSYSVQIEEEKTGIKAIRRTGEGRGAFTCHQGI
jgi:hypothetical protein